MISQEILDRLAKDGRNRVLLSLLEDENFMKMLDTYPVLETYKEELLTNLEKVDLYKFLTDVISEYNFNILSLDYYSFYSEEILFKSDKYKFDEFNGSCEDGDFNCVRYVLASTGKVYKMKSSKFFHKVTANIPLPEVARHWLAEVYADKRKARLISEEHDYILKTGNSLEDFIKIYKSIDSCMRTGNHASFYTESVNATAAWLEDKKGDVVARCIIFNEVFSNNNKTKLRLAERQYSKYEYLKELLILKLIKANLIDGFKKLGSGAGDCNNFVLNDGKKAPKALYIRCDLKNYSVISFQDSFFCYDFRNKIAYNYYGEFSSIKIDTTDIMIFGIPPCNEDRPSYCFKYFPEYDSRVLVPSKDADDYFEYEGNNYSGLYTEIDGIKVPDEYVLQQFDLCENLINQYNGIKSVKSLYGRVSAIQRYLNGNCMSAYGFKWKYKSKIPKSTWG